MASDMEIEQHPQVDETLIVFQGKAENLLQKRQKFIDDLSSNLEKIFHGYLETFASNFQTRSDQLSHLLSAYNEEAVKCDMLKANLQAVQEKTEDLYTELHRALSAQ